MGLDTIKTFPAIPAPFPSNTSPLPAANYQTHHRWGSSKDHSHLKAFKSCCETFNARHVWQRPVADWSPEVLSLTELPGNTSWGKDPSHTQRFSPWKALWTCWGSSISVSQQIRRKQASSSFAETGFPLSFSERIVIFFFSDWKCKCTGCNLNSGTCSLSSDYTLALSSWKA